MRMIPIYLGLCVAALVTAAFAFGAGLSVATSAAREAAAERHQLLGLSACVLLLIVQCAVFVYFLGTGKAIKTAVELRGLDSALADRTRRLKGKAFPFATFTALAVVTGAVLSGAASPSTHSTAMLIALGLTLLAIPFELKAIRENARLMDSTEIELSATEGAMAQRGESLRDPDAAPPAFVLGRLLLVFGASVWLVFAYRALVMRGHPEPWPWYVGASAAGIVLGLPLLVAGRRRTPSGERS